MILVPFDPQHLEGFVAQPHQRREFEAQPEAVAAPYGPAWSALVDGYPIACGGFVEYWPGRAYCWALLSTFAGPYMRPLTREIRFRLAQTPYRRVEMAVDAEFSEGCRWAGILGFELETPVPLKAYLPNGRAAYLYARVK